MRTLHMLPALLALTAPSCTSESDDTETTKPTAPVRDLFGDLAGDWTCETTFPAGAHGPGSPEVAAASALSIAPTLDGTWYRGSLEIPGHQPFRVEFFLGASPTGEGAMLVGVDTNPGSSTGYAPGWQGDSITFLGQGINPGGPVQTRETMTRQGADRVHHRLEVDPGGGFTLLVETACAR